jgi:hypothetical protein
MKSAAISLALVSVLSSGAPRAEAETDVFLRALGFALTGSDDAEPTAIDRSNCVFKVNDNIFRLNNIHTDRIKIQSWQRNTTSGVEKWTDVSLHGDDTVYETTSKGATDDGSEYTKQLKQKMPDLFKSHHYTAKEYNLRLETEDQDRVTRAWNYVYNHGCVGKKSPF